MVFKLERERPASAIYQNQLFYITKEKMVKSYDFTKNIESAPLLSLRKLGSPWMPPRTLSYNPAERAILVTSPADNGTYELVHLPRDSSGALEPTDMKKGSGSSAVFVARNRFAVFTQSSQQVDIKDLTNATTKTIKPPPGTTDVFFGGTGSILMVNPANVVLYDIQQKKQLAELAVAGVKYVVWSSDGLYAALLSKHNVTIVTKSLEQVSTLHETIRIKSAAWDDAGVLLYSTLNHIKYTLLNGLVTHPLRKTSANIYQGIMVLSVHWIRQCILSELKPAVYIVLTVPRSQRFWTLTLPSIASSLRL